MLYRLLQANAIYRSGLERRAQPVERLRKKYDEFQARARNNGCIFKDGVAVGCVVGSVVNHVDGSSVKSIGAEFSVNVKPAGGSGPSRPIEVRGYDAQFIHGGDFSFEEMRAQRWYAKPKIAKPSTRDRCRLPPPLHSPGLRPRAIATIENIYAEDGRSGQTGRSNRFASSDDEDSVPCLGVTVNADDLTHINVFKDNTADMREIARLVKAKGEATATATATSATVASNPAPSHTNTPAAPIATTPTNRKTTTDWLLREIIMSPPVKRPAIDQPAPLSATSPPPLSLPSLGKIGVEVENSASERNSTSRSAKPDQKRATTRVEPAATLDPFDASFRQAQSEAVLSQIAAAIPNVHLRLTEPAAAKVRAFEKSLGRDGSGPNHTVSSLRIASGHFFMERKLGEGGYGKVYLAVDLMTEEPIVEEDTERPVNQVAIKLEQPAAVWEAYIMFRVHSFLEPLQAPILARHFPRLLSASIYSDVSFLVMDYFEQGSLLAALNVYRQQNLSMDETLVLFYAAELLKIVGILHKASIIHTDIKLENLLLYSTNGGGNDVGGGVIWSSVFRRDGGDGWSDRGLVLIDYGRAVDMKLFKEEDACRFFIKPRHHAFNGSPRIAQGLPVSHEMDWFGVADSLHWLLFQKALVPVLHGSSARLSSPLKRYWQIDIWEPLFRDLLNPPETLTAALGVFRVHMETICQRLESWKKTPSLKSLLTRQEIMLYEHLPRVKP